MKTDGVTHNGVLDPGNYKTAEAIENLSYGLSTRQVMMVIFRTLERLQAAKYPGPYSPKSFLLEELEREHNGGPKTNL